MSLRDFNTVPPSDDPIALHNEPMGNGSGLSAFHTVSPEEREPNNTPKIVGAVAVALLVGAAAVGLYAYSGPSSKSVVANNSLPQTAPVTPPQQTAMTDNSAPANAPAAPINAAPPPPAPAPAASTEMPKPAPVRTASVRHSHIRSASSEGISGGMSTPSASSQTAQVPQPAQTTPVPEQAQATPLPAAPTPSPSDVASNRAAVPNNGTTASDIPQASTAPQQLQSSTPQASNAAPAQDQQSGATPPAAQPPAQ